MYVCMCVSLRRVAVPHVRVVPAEPGEAQDERRVVLVRRDREEHAVAVGHARTEVTVPHELPHLLGPGQVLREVVLRPRQALLQGRQAFLRRQRLFGS